MIAKPFILFPDCINSIYVVFNSVKSWEIHLNILCQKRKIRAFMKVSWKLDQV